MTCKTSTLTQSRLQELLHYDQLTGVFRWRVQRRKIAAGTIAGTVGENGYRRIQIDGTTYRANRLAFLYVNGGWPEGEADHRNKKRSDNRFSNLRDATKIQNLMNSGKRSTNTTGFKGVFRRGNKFRAKINLGSSQKYLGTFSKAEEAAMAYDAAARLHHGEYAGLNFPRKRPA